MWMTIGSVETDQSVERLCYQTRLEILPSTLIMSDRLKPNFFIIGAPKCATTSMAAWLAAHPYIFMSPKKEPHFFNTDERQEVSDLEEYMRLFQDAPATCCDWRGLRLVSLFVGSRRKHSPLSARCQVHRHGAQSAGDGAGAARGNGARRS